MALSTKQEALDYHHFPRPGKLAVLPSRPCSTQKYLSLAYSLDVAELVPLLMEIIVKGVDNQSFQGKSHYSHIHHHCAWLLAGQIKI